MGKYREIDVAFHRACAMGTVEDVRELAVCGADVASMAVFEAGNPARVGVPGLTPVYRAAALNPQAEVLRCLVEELGADLLRLAKEDWSERPPLFYAVRRNTPEVAEFLIEHGDSPEWENYWEGNFTIDEAARNPDGRVMSLLMEKGAKPECSTLARALTSGTMEMVERLAGMGLDFHTGDADVACDGGTRGASAVCAGTRLGPEFGMAVARQAPLEVGGRGEGRATSASAGLRRWG